VSYNLNNFDGRAFTTIADGVIDQQASSSLYLIGKNVTSYGTYQNDNFLWLTENFAGTVEPVNKIQGQIWFDRTPGILKPKIYDGGEWKTFSFSEPTATQPINAQTGDYWFDTDNEQLYVKGNNGFVLIGPDKIIGATTKTKLESVAILDSSSVAHDCIVLYADDAIVGVISNDVFTVKSTEAVYQAGITSVQRGITMDSGASVSSELAYANKSNNETITGIYTFTNAININTAIFGTDGASNAYLNTQGRSFQIIATSIVPGDSSTLLGSSSLKFAKVYASELNGGSSISPVTLTGDFSLAGKFSPSADATILLGAANARWSSVFTSGLNAGGSSASGTITGQWSFSGGSSLTLPVGQVLPTGTRSYYADIAERYTSDKDYSSGTVMMFGGSAEVTACTEINSSKVAGIVTTDPAQILNSELENSVAIALVGRVPCRVVGKISKGDLLVPGNLIGTAISTVFPKPGALIGKALEDYDSEDIGTIEVMVVRG
jgi:hypothetical protein